MSASEFTWQQVMDLTLGEGCDDAALIKRFDLMASNSMNEIGARLADDTYYQCRVEWSITAGKANYGLDEVSPGKTIRLIECIYGDDCDIEPLPDEMRKKARRDTTPGKPKYIDMFASELVVYPIPDADYTFTIEMARNADCVVDLTKVVDVPPNYQSVLVKHLRGLMELEGEDYGAASNFLNLASAEFDTQKEVDDRGLTKNADAICLVRIGGAPPNCDPCGDEKITEPLPSFDPDCFVGNKAAYERSSAYSTRSQT